MANKTICRLCQQNKGDHVWQRGIVIGSLCGRCFYWLVGNYKNETGGKVGMIESVAIIAGCGSLLAGGFRVATFYKVQAINNHCSIDTVMRIAHGKANLPVIESMRRAGIKPPHIWSKAQCST